MLYNRNIESWNTEISPVELNYKRRFIVKFAEIMELGMNLQAKKLELVQLIINTKKPLTLKKVEDILKKEEESDWWDEISEAERQSIEKGLAEADRGELIAHEEVMKEVKAKYKLD
jgi:thiamine pyrophosphate-dependent acetolactate synthase large subunit-like protein